jgi:hypothetical protein
LKYSMQHNVSATELRFSERESNFYQIHCQSNKICGWRRTLNQPFRLLPSTSSHLSIRVLEIFYNILYNRAPAGLIASVEWMFFFFEHLRKITKTGCLLSISNSFILWISLIYPLIFRFYQHWFLLKTEWLFH